MAKHVDMTKKKGETIAQFVRRFSRAFRDTNISRQIRANRYYARNESDLRRKQSAMARISNGKKYAKLRKLGKI